ncbi:hypothetical protein Tco_0619890, partial [Tanacetum coccineum]
MTSPGVWQLFIGKDIAADEEGCLI